MSLVPLTALGTLIFAFVNFLKYVSARNWNGVLTQLIAWAAGVVGILVFAQTAFAAAVTFGGVPLPSMGFWSQLFIGLMATSILSTLNEGYKALDPTQTAEKPKLFPRLKPAAPVSATPVTSIPPPAAAVPPHRTG